MKKNLKSSLVTLCALTTLAACDMEKPFQVKSKKSSSSNVVTNTIDANKIIVDKEDSSIQFHVMSESQLKKSSLQKTLSNVTKLKSVNILTKAPQGSAVKSINKLKVDLGPQEENLIVGFPVSLLGEQNIFGGVITKVGDKDSELLGGLKLTDLTPVHVRPVIGRGADGGYVMTLAGCFSNCDELSEPVGLISLPIVGLNEDNGQIMLDLSAIGKELDLVTMLDPRGEYTKLKAISSDTVHVDYDMKTLIFDIKTRMIPTDATPGDANAKVTEFTVRWYLKLNSASNPSFEPRLPISEVGYFKTERTTQPKIQRWSATPVNGAGQATVHYYIKNVPKKYEKFITGAFDAWNKETQEILNRPLLSYEIVKPEDNDLYIPGDIRYNVLEWDLENVAGYGGLGPSIANQHTGEIMSANVLIQGPMVEKIYTKWFGISQKVDELKQLGKIAAANELIKQFHVETQAELAQRNKLQFKMKLGKHLDMNVRSQSQALQDPIGKDFEIVPAGWTYMQYMEGYFLDMVAHELGHNLGLRHNFKGNLGANESGEKGSVSRSIMEYLNRNYRHLDGIGLYDRMAIRYGYLGEKPQHANWFCTDEDEAHEGAEFATKSPECSKNDATSDPFSFYEQRLNRVIDLLVDRQSNSAPVWKLDEVKDKLEDTLKGLSGYALSAENTAETWTNFFGKADRPDDKTQVKNYVLARIKKKVCAPSVTAAIRGKESAEAQKLAAENLNALKEAIVKKQSELGLTQDLNCEE